MYAESGLKPNNLQNSYAKLFGMTDAEYTLAVDKGTYKDFATDGAGYGIAQWTYKARKQNMLAASKCMHMSIGNLGFQLYFLCAELRNYSVVLDILRTATSIQQASDAFLTMYEKPANTTQENKNRRANLSLEFYNALKDEDVESYEYIEENTRVLKRYMNGDDVAQLQRNLIELGYDLGKSGADGFYGTLTKNAVKTFQHEHGLYEDGIAGALTQDLILEVLVWKQPEVVEEDEVEPLYKIVISDLEEDVAEELFNRFENYPVEMERIN